MNETMSGTFKSVEPVRPSLRPETESGETGNPTSASSSLRWTGRLVLPREHGAWGIVSLPFIVASIVAGSSPGLRTVAAALAVFALFLLRAPVLALFRKGAGREQEMANARWSLAVYFSVATIAGMYLLIVLPRRPLVLMGVGAAALAVITIYFSLKNRQRNPFLQVAGSIGLTASSLPAYLAATGRLDEAAFWIWGLFAAHSSASVLLVHARLEWIIAARKPKLAQGLRPHRRDALIAQAGILALMAVVAVIGKPWLAVPFLPPLALHVWEFRRMKAGHSQKISLQRVGYWQLFASIAFAILLIPALSYGKV